MKHLMACGPVLRRIFTVPTIGSLPFSRWSFTSNDVFDWKITHSIGPVLPIRPIWLW